MNRRESDRVKRSPMPIKEYFSSSYSEARLKFVAAARGVKAELDSYRLTGRSGPGNEDLIVDVAKLGPENARNMLLVISGTHGVEGFAVPAVRWDTLTIDCLKFCRRIPAQH